MRAYFESQIDEIRSDTALRLYGAALALVNVVTALFWVTIQPVSQMLAPHEPPICWPFWENCYRVRFLSPAAIELWVSAIAIFSVLDAVLFLSRRHAATAYWLLVTLSTLKAALIVQDYRLILNQHYMAFTITAAFLFVPNRRLVLPAVLVSFYFWAGLLKLNGDWLSGAGLYGRRPLGLPAAAIPAACAFVVVLELVVVFGLLVRRHWAFWPAFCAVILFHVASFWVVGFFYPVLMFLVLTIFLSERRRPISAHAAAGRKGRPAMAVAATLSLFAALQIFARTFPGDSAITGEGRLLALNMFDAPLQCRASFLAYGGANTHFPLPTRVRFLNARINCDPIIYFELAKHYCRVNDARHEFSDFDVTLVTRRQRESTFRDLVRIPSFCGSGTTYSVLRHNAWIRAIE